MRGSTISFVTLLGMVDRAPRILLVDDEHAIQTLLSYPLRKDGYEVVQATDGRRAARHRGAADRLRQARGALARRARADDVRRVRDPRGAREPSGSRLHP